jgi:hypothetical protein
MEFVTPILFRQNQLGNKRFVRGPHPSDGRVLLKTIQRSNPLNLFSIGLLAFDLLNHFPESAPLNYKYLYPQAMTGPAFIRQWPRTFCPSGGIASVLRNNILPPS